jgi:hypothetical protein
MKSKVFIELPRPGWVVEGTVWASGTRRPEEGKGAGASAGKKGLKSSGTEV